MKAKEGNKSEKRWAECMKINRCEIEKKEGRNSQSLQKKNVYI